MQRRSLSDLGQRVTRGTASRAGYLGLGLGLLACSGGAGHVGAGNAELAENTDSATDTQLAATELNTGPRTLDRSNLRAAVHALQGDVDTLLLAAALVEDRAERLSESSLRESFGRISNLTAAAASAGDALSALEHDSVEDDAREELAGLSRAAAQIPVQVKRLKRALEATGKGRAAHAALFTSLDTLKVAAGSLGTSVAEAQQARGFSALDHLSLAEQQAVTTHSGPLFPSSSWYVLTEGHADVIDVAYEDDELGISIHDESVTPDVERDPATTILLVKSSARVQVPDDRFAFLGPVGSDVWILPEGQAEAEAASLLWPGIATAEVPASVFVDDAIEVRFREVVGPNGLSLFESPEDELSPPGILVDSEDGLPDTVVTPAGVHRHANWAFESPGLYLVRVQARGRLAELPGHPWVSSENAILKFVVVP
jgi:surface-anchored protein